MKTALASGLPAFTRFDAESWVARLGRLGFAARGFVYIVLGIVAARAAFGFGGKVTDKQGAVREMQKLPFGDFVLWVVGIGLLGYIAWRFAQAFMDLDHKGSDLKGLTKRAGAVIVGLAHLGICSAALALAAHRPKWNLRSGRSSDAAAQDWTAWLMSQPFGRWLVAIAGGVVGAIAGYQFYRAITCDFTKHLGGGLTATQEMWSRRVGRIGYAARGVAFALIAWFLVKAALEFDPSRAGGLGTALRTLKSQPFGAWMLGAVGAGLALFGVYSIVEARYRRIG
jgi:hypothetical protein